MKELKNYMKMTTITSWLLAGKMSVAVNTSSTEVYENVTSVGVSSIAKEMLTSPKSGFTIWEL